MTADEQVRERLAHVLDPELGVSIVELGMVGSVDVDDDGLATVAVALTTAACPLRAQIVRDVREAALSLDAVTEVKVTVAVMDAPAKRELMSRARAAAQLRAPDTSIPPRSRS